MFSEAFPVILPSSVLYFPHTLIIRGLPQTLFPLHSSDPLCPDTPPFIVPPPPFPASYPLCFPGFFVSVTPGLCSHLKSSRRTCDLCLLGVAYLTLYDFFQFHPFIHNVHGLVIGWWSFRLFPFPNHCEYATVNMASKCLWNKMLSALGRCQGVI